MTQWYKVTAIDEQGKNRDCGFYPSMEVAQECVERAQATEDFAKWEFTYSPLDLGPTADPLKG